VIDVTRRSIEETSTSIFQLYSRHLEETASGQNVATESD